MTIGNHDSNTEGFLKEDDSARLLELINSPPPMLPPSSSDSPFRLSTNFSISSSLSLSESLTTPSRQIKRRTNEYVKNRPQSREVLENEENQQRNSIDTDSSITDFDPRNPEEDTVTTTAVIVHQSHQETAL